MLKRYWRGLPWDGLGWTAGDDPILAELRVRAATNWRSSKPWMIRSCLWLADRLLWPLSAALQTRIFAEQLQGVHLPGLFRDCLISGAVPLEAHVWRSVFGTIHPLPARAAARLMTLLGDPFAHHLLTDKLATAEHLADADVVFPALLEIYRQNQTAVAPTINSNDAGLFIKPRHGHGGRGCFALTRTGTQWLMDGRPVQEIDLLDRLGRLSRMDDLLIQERLVAAPDLSGLCTDDRPPVLRIVTAQPPGEAPFLHSAMLAIGIPGRNPQHFLDGALYVPIDTATGRLSKGLCLAEPKRRVTIIDWNGAPLFGRLLESFGDASAMALRAMAALPPVPLVHWDMILTPAGPVMLEGNSSGNWIIVNLPGLFGLATCELPPLLERWAAATSASETHQTPR